MIKRPNYIGNQYIINMAQTYLDAGMPPQAVMKMIKFDWDQRNKDFTYINNVKYEYIDNIHSLLGITEDSSDNLTYYVYNVGTINKSHLQQALLELAEEDSQLIYDIIIAQIPQVVLADRMGVTPGTISYRKQKILKKLRENLIKK